jgi:hypothetical protein
MNAAPYQHTHQDRRTPLVAESTTRAVRRDALTWGRYREANDDPSVPTPTSAEGVRSIDEAESHTASDGSAQ